MPSINRIRVNNVKYNFGSQFYDDFTMRMYGKNTLYDLANGGGKSVLMLLLLQNMIPNCTLDEKQPIEKLFRTGNGNTTIHSLVEWKLDKDDSSEGYRYMTTGFCARKAKESGDEADTKRDVASIEYFNYCIFYREYNKNDIVNLPLVKDGERVGFSSLKSYLKELEHKDMSLKVRIFDRKGEYQRFISDYGIHESQWEIIRGINKTEGHVRTYFENNYKTTRRVVEDLLIEEIIEKAFMVKTMREESGDVAMANMLMDIKEQLTVLAKKKKDMAAYDHQIELIDVLSDKVGSFMELYKEQSRLEGLMADICVTGEEFAKQDEAKMEELARRRDAKRREKDEQRRYMECLKVARDKNELADIRAKKEQLNASITEAKDRLDKLYSELNLKEGINEYIDYLEDKKKYVGHEAVIKTMMAGSAFDQELLYTYAYNIKMRMDAEMKRIRSQISTITEELTQKRLDKEYHEKLLHEAELAKAVAVSTRKDCDEDIVSISEQLSAIRMSMSRISFVAAEEQYENTKHTVADILAQIEAEDKTLSEKNDELNNIKLNISKLEARIADNERELCELADMEKQYETAHKKLESIQTVYGAHKEDELGDIITGKITDTVMELAYIRDEIASRKKNLKRLSEGRIIAMSSSAKKVADYLETRHGISAIYGMDYISALPEDRRLELLEVNPELPYGLLVDDYETVKDDHNITSVDTGSEIVNIYDMSAVSEKAIISGENIISIHASKEYLTEPSCKEKLIKLEEDSINELEQNRELKEEMLATYRQDHEFVIKLSDSTLAGAVGRLEEARALKASLGEEHDKLNKLSKEVMRDIRTADDSIIKLKKDYELSVADLSRLEVINRLSGIIADKEEASEKCRQDIERLEDTIRAESSALSDSAREDDESAAALDMLEKKLQDMIAEWDNKYNSYYNVDAEYEVLTLSDDELKARFTAMLDAGKDDVKAIEDKRLVMDTLKTSMDRTLKGIEKRGLSIEKLKQYEADNLVYLSDDELLGTLRKDIETLKDRLKSLEGRYKDTEKSENKLEGSIEYAIANIEAAFGSYEEQQASASEIVTNLKNGKELLDRLEAEARDCEEQFKTYKSRQGYMLDLYKDVKRIIDTSGISMEAAKPIAEDKDKLRDIFEANLLNYDRSTKALDRAKNELLRFKGNTAVALDKMEVYELARTIREDVVIPADYDNANILMENLKSITEYIRLERDRISKSLVDMETIKSNFEEQCLQRCLDVKTELDKLPKLSRIVVDGEAIQMVGLTIPYVKEEFLKQKMSDYIDKVVAQADDYDSDKDRIKFIRGSLTLKKLFSVIVTDMNAIKLSLYKRERIKEQSRYLKYEEAVGSTGQSQGIYIQFLVSIINYISGMYQIGSEDVRTKTIFIDNPFGAAKDVYIWEPIFALLAANNVQLIVPARGATPAITGRFDVNYILGQQMVGGKQLTVVCDYTSKANQEELEYKDLEYEQVSFDFI